MNNFIIIFIINSIGVYTNLKLIKIKKKNINLKEKDIHKKKKDVFFLTTCIRQGMKASDTKNIFQTTDYIKVTFIIFFVLLNKKKKREDHKLSSNYFITFFYYIIVKEKFFCLISFNLTCWNVLSFLSVIVFISSFFNSIKITTWNIVYYSRFFLSFLLISIRILFWFVRNKNVQNEYLYFMLKK